MPSFPQQTNPGSFVPTTGSKDSSQSGELGILALRENLNNIAMILNTKDSGYYALTEFVNGQVWYPDPALTSATVKSPTLRQVFRKVISCPALLNAGTLTVAHGIVITPGFSFTRIYGCATDPSTEFIPLPYASPVLVENISLRVDANNVYITTGNDRTMFTTTYVVLEFIKS